MKTLLNKLDLDESLSVDAFEAKVLIIYWSES
jgi:hypothetical protein